VTDELGRIDINHASPDLLADLFEAAGVGQPETLAASVDAFREQRRTFAVTGNASPQVELQNALRRGAPFASTEDLQNVPGMSPDILQRLRHAITVYSGRALPVIAAAPPVVRAAMNAAELSTSQTGLAELEVTANELTESPTLLSAPPGQGPRGSGVYRIHAAALTEGGSHFAREAVIALKGKRDKVPYDVRLWHRGARLHFLPPE